MADIDVTITIPDAYVTRVLETFNNLSDKDILMRFAGGRTLLNYSEKAVEETNLEFGKRVIRQLILSLMRVNEANVESERVIADIDAVVPITINVTEDIIL